MPATPMTRDEQLDLIVAAFIETYAFDGRHVGSRLQTRARQLVRGMGEPEGLALLDEVEAEEARLDAIAPRHKGLVR